MQVESAGTGRHSPVKPAQATDHPVSQTAPSVIVDVVGAVALVIYSVTASAAFAALIFTGPTAAGLPRGASTFLFASGLVTVFLGLRSRFPVAFGVVQDTAAIVLVPAVAVIVDNGSDDPVRDVFVVLSVSTLLTGVVMWGIGQARLGAAARFMPTTVVAGFLAGTGWLLAKGGMDVMTDRSLQLGDLGDLVGGDLAKFWLPGMALGILVALVPLVPKVSPVVSSIATVASVGGFFVLVAIASTLDAVESGGWLLGPFPDGGSPSFVVSDLADADWTAVGSASGQLGVVVVLSLLGVLLNISGIQSLLKQRVDIDAEMRTVGIINIVSASIGGLVGYHGLGDSALADRLGVRRRAVPMVVGAATAIFAFVGIGTLGYLPKFVAGGLLIGAGLSLLVSWIIELRATPGWADRAVSVLILLVISFVGILEGIVVGIVAACVFFVVRYSRLDAVRVVSSGVERRSVVGRSPEERDRLDGVADRLAVYELHGSLFFGSVSGVAGAIRERLARVSSPIEVVIVDFARVAGIDSSAYAVLAELANDIEHAGAVVVWSGMDPPAAAVLSRVGAETDAVVIANLDAALEFSEDDLLARHESQQAVIDEVSAPYSDQLLAWFDTRSAAAGDVLMNEGDESSELVVVVSGSVHVSRRDRNGDEVRLRTLRPGAIVGEIGFLNGDARTATVTAETDVELRVLTASSHERLRSEEPGVVIELYDRVLKSTADRAAAIHRSLTQALR